MHRNSRRSFIKQTALYAFSVTSFGIAGCRKPGKAVKISNCGTTEDILGPFYRANAPLRSDLTFAGQNNLLLRVQGTVFGEDCTSPLANVLIEFWQSDSEGRYDNNSADFRFRGRQQTPQDGKYAFTTIVPGRYLNGDTYRPSHIHFRVTAQGYKELVSQIYFKEDPFLSTDPWASRPAAQLRILEMETGTGSSKTVNFPIYMTKS